MNLGHHMSTIRPIAHHMFKVGLLRVPVSLGTTSKDRIWCALVLLRLLLLFLLFTIDLLLQIGHLHFVLLTRREALIMI